MDATLKNALAQPAPWLFGAIRIDFPGYTLRLLDGSAEFPIGGEMYRGMDPTFGTIASLSEMSEDMDDSAPEVELTLFPPDVSAAAILSHPDMQGSPVRIMVGAIDPYSGAVLGTPETLFLGEIDVPTVAISESGERTVSYTIVSVFERLFEVEEGQRASDSWHQSIWPGELGLEFMTGTDVNLYWGAKPPAGTTQKSSLGALASAAAKRMQTL
ncbi:hypothetical protein DM806_24060 [Sphingobium lactosutens]|uniref:hypothetical protein n=1 Tax=Sphingobium lactosutens TaxID=522773 RepID=UPI0015B9F4B3|nr:hypothetical protein [Sphingobium lactosutens]NWK98681.1 hypothetical protein [Sphingobium lactosutens]